MSTQEPDAARIFLDAVENCAPDQRPAFVDDACQGNPELRARVVELLKAHGESNALLDNERPIATLELAPLEQPGTQIGPYKLVEQIGEGGFGVVFLAEQATPIRRRVALKIVKPGMDTRQVIARFEAERQALALMDHPGIAKVFDAGVTEQGRSYFVMELVQGVPINEYCDECNLPTRERLSLFIAVCQAVQHAHQKGIIHRDLKPTNVLVAMQDGRPVPKIIDFGIAKAIEQRLTEHTLTTAFAQMVGTPMYMSPEQAELSPLGVDTRSDIYSLGVLLYELLAGSTPFDKDRLHSASYDELRRIIREEEPPRPSTRLTTLAADLATTVAQRRRTDASRLEHEVRGELDWIVMKCLEKDRNRRYDSAGSLARDIERHLHDEPVQACPPSAGYRFHKFARRNKMLLGASGAIAAALFIGLGLSTWMYFRAATERDRAQAVSNLLQEMLGSATPALETNTDYTIHQLMIYDDVRIAHFLASTHREGEATEFVRKAALNAARLTEPADAVNALAVVALGQLRLGDQTGYRATCKALADVPIAGANDLTKGRAILAWCLGPNALADRSLAVKCAEEFAAHNLLDYCHFGPYLFGAALYRDGQYERAAEELKKSIAVYRNDPPPGFAQTDIGRVGADTINCQQLFLAMTKLRQGEHDDARQLLREIQPAIDKELETPTLRWGDRAATEVLRREAEALIEPKATEEVVENKNIARDADD